MLMLVPRLPRPEAVGGQESSVESSALLHIEEALPAKDEGKGWNAAAGENTKTAMEKIDLIFVQDAIMCVFLEWLFLVIKRKRL